MKTLLFILTLLYSLTPFAQKNDLRVFENLVGSTWISEGKQLGGHMGKTVKAFEWGLDGKIVKVKTYSTDPKTLEFGLRNEGVRILNVKTKQIEFYEFDKRGGVSQGIILLDDNNIHYEYAYGDLTLRDSWIYISESEYHYRVCSIKGNECDQVYHEGIFRRK